MALEKEIKKVLKNHNALHCWPGIESSLRHAGIIYEYKKLRKQGHTGRQARKALADKLFLSEKSIEWYIYGKRKTN